MNSRTPGRGARSSPPGRFETTRREAFDDGWPESVDDEGEGVAGNGEGVAGRSSMRSGIATEVTDEQARRILTFNRSPDVPFDRTINPYRGCEHGCTYCFARPTHAYLGLSPGLDFETRLRAKVNAVELLRAELAAPGYRCAPVNIGASTDAYQPIERSYRLTRGVIEMLAECAHPLTIVTKSSLVERDIDLLAPMAARGLAAVYLTITTLDERLARSWEPRAVAPWRRLRTIRKLADAGVHVGVSLSPLVPFLNEPEIEQVLEQARDAGARSAFYTIVRLPWELREVFGDWLRAAYPDRAERVLNRIGEMRATSASQSRPSRRLNDARFFHRMRGAGEWAQLVQLRFRLAASKLGLNRERFELRSDLFTPPGGRPKAAAADPPAQASLF